MYGLLCEDRHSYWKNRWSRWSVFGYVLAVVLILGASVAHGAESHWEQLDKGLHLIHSGNLAEGYHLIEEIANELRDEMDGVESLVILGQAYFYLEEDDEALAAFARAIELDPTAASAHFFSGLIHLFASNLDEAIRSLELAVEHEPNVDVQWLELGRAYGQAGRGEEALQAYERSLEINPANITALYNSAALLIELRGEAEALERFLRVLDIDPQNVDAAFAVGRILHDQGNDREALGYFKTVAAIEPDNWHARTYVIRMYQALGEYAHRDKVRAELFALRRSGRLPELSAAEYYVRDRFRHEGRLVYALEYFDFDGPRPVRYQFDIVDTSTGWVEMIISLGSYEITRTIFKELEDADVELFHLDGYWPNGSHTAFHFYGKEPTYDTVKSHVLEVLSGDLKGLPAIDFPELEEK